MSKIVYISFAVCLFLAMGCQHPKTLKTVSVKDFGEFVEATGYVTDAEKFGWSIVQQTVYDYVTVTGATWRKPDGKHPAKPDNPVTQVSYNDAIAYCQWAKVSLPSYETYWKIAKKDKRRINVFYDSILPPETVNIIGNVWEITKSEDNLTVRMAGGSFLCNKNTCDGTNPKRELIVDPMTGNIHVSFAVLVDE